MNLPFPFPKPAAFAEISDGITARTYPENAGAFFSSMCDTAHPSALVISGLRNS